ncbi:hypothetical protein [Mycobacterium lepromatosis]|uniref:hypothetical protein n=1 Tax=Mycobacterium lepromatosis TaxID=480418 RepID=UPI0005F8536A|nr:hypothetical protein [Mycobacterium lepromatosis]
MLATTDPATLSLTELTDWTLLRAANTIFMSLMLGEAEQITAFLQAISTQVTDTGPHATRLTPPYAMNASNVGKAVEITGNVLNSPSTNDLAAAWEASTAHRARSGQAASTVSSQWHNACWTPNIPDCCAARSDWAGQPLC